MDKNVDDILSKSQYGQIRRGYPQSLVNLSMDKNVDDTQMISLVNLSMDKNVDDILSKSQYGQIRRGYPQ